MTPSFWQWYYQRGIKYALAVYHSLIIITFDFFSIPILARTLFEPWKRDVVEPEAQSLQLIIQAFGFNLVSHLIGFIARASVVAGGLASTGAVIILGALALIISFGAPLFSPLLIIWGGLMLSRLDSSSVLLGLLGMACGAAPLGAFFLEWKVDRWRDTDPKTPLKNALEENLDPNNYLTVYLNQVVSQTKTVGELKKNLLESPQTVFILSKAGISPSDFSASPLPQTLTVAALLSVAAQTAVAKDQRRIGVGDLIQALFDLDPSLLPLLAKQELNKSDLADICSWADRFFVQLDRKSDLLDPSSLKLGGGIGKNWSAGWTNLLDRFSLDLTESVSSSAFDQIFIAHAPQIDEIERVLARSGRHNVMLVGASGTGKRTTALGFARRVLVGKTLRPLVHKRVVELDIGALTGSASSADELEGLIVKLLNESVRAGNVILYLDTIERLFLASPGSLGQVNAAALILPYLNSPRLQLIGATDIGSWHKAIERFPSLEGAFEKIAIQEPDETQTLRILEDVSPSLEAKYSLIVTFKALKRTVAQTKRYLPERTFPQKALDILDETALQCQSQGKKAVQAEDIDRLISQKTHIPVADATEEKEREALLNLEDRLRQRLVNQTHATAAIAGALRRARSGVASPSRPVGSFLMLGPTGVGKTETAKALAEFVFGSPQKMIRLDLSEYQDPLSVNRLIGQGESGGVLTDKIRETPYAVVLLDEIEKASPNVLDLFLQVLDEGRLTDALGQTANFTNAVIIATSNAGANLIRQEIVRLGAKLDMDGLTKKLLDSVQNEGVFKPEFINRFDAVLAYRPLNVGELEEVVDRQVELLNQRLVDKQISVKLDPEAKRKLAELGFNPEYGARALVRVVAKTIENRLSQAILKGEVQNGQVFAVDKKMIE